MTSSVLDVSTGEATNRAHLTDSLVVELNGKPTVKGPDPAQWPVSVRSDEK